MSDPFFISVDVEAAGPFPGAYSLLTLGACVVDDVDISFEAALQPTTRAADPAALAVTGLSLEDLAVRGDPPETAMARFAAWVAEVTPEGRSPVFVGLNAAFDWAFVNHYFLTYHAENPFGFAPLDIKALYMGRLGCAWPDARSSVMRDTLGAILQGDHSALHDARAQAELFRLILARAPRADGDVDGDL